MSELSKSIESCTSINKLARVFKELVRRDGSMRKSLSGNEANSLGAYVYIGDVYKELEKVVSDLILTPSKLTVNTTAVAELSEFGISVNPMGQLLSFLIGEVELRIFITPTQSIKI